VLGPGAVLVETGALVGAPPPFELEAQPAATSAVTPSRTVRTARCRMIASINYVARVYRAMVRYYGNACWDLPRTAIPPLDT
jgi:hypothetical protein